MARPLSRDKQPIRRFDIRPVKGYPWRQLIRQMSESRMTVFETECYQVFERGDRLVGREKPSRVLNENARVFVAAIEGDTRTAVKVALGAIGVKRIFSPGDRVAAVTIC